ncbi:MAG TPA: hypothetical protein VFX92_11250 [Candidatus Krumholzibacteria bacterium]|nr:hypothetical protein [Candidatus Krumholzibacteria bacterium]
MFPGNGFLRRPSPRTGGRLLLLALVVTLGGLAACANYMARSTAIRGALASGAYEEALDQAADIDPSNSLLLLLYEQGLIYHCKGDYDESNLAFARAEAVLDELYTRSITRGIASLAVSETIEQYRGDPFEAVFVNYYKILNYLALGEVDEAMVECRRVNRRLQMFKDGGDTYFEDDPFLQYMTGLVYTRGRELTDAEVSYRRAIGLYDDPEFQATAPAPGWAYCDAAALARIVGDADDASAYAAHGECPPEGLSRVNIMLDCGQIAAKAEESIVLPIFEDDRWDDDEEFAHVMAERHGKTYRRDVRVKYWLKVALPRLEQMPQRYTRVVVRARSSDPRAGSDAEVTAVMVENLDAHAARAFQEKQSTLLVRAIVRALIKYAAHGAADSKDPGLGAVVNIFNIITETADTRSWSTLPQAVWMGRLDLPPGQYEIEADVFTPDGVRGASALFHGVQVPRGGIVFRNARIF